ncbi:uncharacterized protein VP01_2598g4 [Puccinia sorghi]|uniref:Uncharacterized protein n=1 Tax=Puccinia sorghi TaxID=27349 RepID=A0A0L6V4Q0_9BASI|nr:uncharacterized protein VP01_2598g4 [Puccinia sorghi]
MSKLVLEYLENSILPVKEHFEVAWASHFSHLRNFNVHIESGHNFIRIFIPNSSGDLLSALARTTSKYQPTFCNGQG